MNCKKKKLVDLYKLGEIFDRCWSCYKKEEKDLFKIIVFLGKIGIE